MFRIFFIIYILSQFALSCEGDCSVCHAKIYKNGKYTKNHESLSTCKICHTPEKLEKIDMGNSACGQDCFACHQQEKIINSGVKEHEVLEKCKSCHQQNDLKSTIFKNNSSTLQKSLNIKF